MCSNQVLHCYASPLQAVFLNPVHANIQNPILLEIECSKIINADGLKYACKEQTPLRELSLPILTPNQRVAVAIKLAMCGYQSPTWLKWAKDWLAGVNRTDASAAYAASAADAAYADARAAARAANAANAYANAYAAANAAASAANAAYAATYAADAATYAASAAFPNFLQETLEWAITNIE